uniref:Uncharacterized protein n=1 Tax=Romanomermis culicivorax TaxID=13658 RepID=A0A915JXM0_ROMCU
MLLIVFQLIHYIQYMVIFYFATYLSSISDYHQFADWFFNATAYLMEKYHILVLFAIVQQLLFFLKQYYSCPVDLNNGKLYRPITAPVFQTLASLFWLHYSQNQVVAHDPRAFMWLTSVVCSNLVFRLLIHMMINTTPRLTTWFLNVYVFVIIATVLTPMSLGLELLIVRSMAIFATIYHVHYITSLVNFHTYNDERPKHSKMFKNYMGGYGYLR